jgi:hypothetical protein
MMRDWIFRTERFFLSVTIFWSGLGVNISWVIRVKIIVHKFLAVFLCGGLIPFVSLSAALDPVAKKFHSSLSTCG